MTSTLPEAFAALNDAILALDTAGKNAARMDVEFAAATERLGVRDISSAQTRVSAAHALLAEQGRNLTAVSVAFGTIEKTLHALKGSPAPAQPVTTSDDTIVTWAKREHPETDIGNGYQLAIFAKGYPGEGYANIWAAYKTRHVSKPAEVPMPPATQPNAPQPDPAPLPAPYSGPGLTVRNWAPGPRGSMDTERMVTPVMAYAFRAKAGAVGNITTAEHAGDGRFRQHCTSLTAGDFDSPLARASSSGPGATSTITRVSVGVDKPGHTRIEAGVYYVNVRAAERGDLGGWDANFAAQQYLVGIGVAA